MSSVDVLVIEAKLDALTSRIDLMLTDHERRLREIERLVWRASGVAALLGMLGGKVLVIIFGGMS